MTSDAGHMPASIAFYLLGDKFRTSTNRLARVLCCQGQLYASETLPENLKWHAKLVVSATVEISALFGCARPCSFCRWSLVGLKLVFHSIPLSGKAKAQGY
eukprot:6211216-Pleurochrysis_carterae.AAC.4